VRGGEIQQALGDHILVGATRVEEHQQDAVYNLEGMHSIIRLGEHHSMRLEYARSESRSEPTYQSTDGGLSWGEAEADITASDSNRSGDAISLHGRSAFSEGRMGLTYYARNFSDGFSSGGTHHQRGQEASGFDLNHRFSEQLSARLKHHQQTELSETSTDQTASSSTVQGTYWLGDKLSFTGELLHRVNNGIDQNTFALQGHYQFDDDTEISLAQQGALEGGERQTRIEARKQIRLSDNLIIKGLARHNNSGFAFGIDGNYFIGDRLSLSAGLEQNSSGQLSSRVGTGYSYKPNENSSYQLSLNSSALDNGKSVHGLSLSTDQRLGDNTNISAGTSLSISGDNRRNSKDARLSHRLANGREVYGVLSNYNTYGADSINDGHEISLGGDIATHWTGFLQLGQGNIHRLNGGLDKRKNMAIGANYQRPTDDQQRPLEARLRYEVRQDRGEDNHDTTLVNMKLKGRPNQSITLMGSLNWGRSEDLNSGAMQVQNNRFDIDMAYRPVHKDRLNLLAKYSWVEDKQPEGQVGALGLEEQNAQVLSTDILYDLSSKWRLGTKLALRYGKEKTLALPWAQSERWLVATRMGYNIAQNTQLNIEYRLLKDIRAQDQKQGSVIELVQRFNGSIEVGLGVNYAGVSDDLGQMDYTEQLGYLRITGVLQ